MVTMLFKKMIRTAWKYKAQFFSMILMICIGMGVFMGANAEWYSLQKDTSYLFEQTNYADYRIYNEKGFSQSDIEAVKAIDGVEAASRFFAVNVGIKDSKSTLALTAVEDYNVSTAYLIDGAEYDAASDSGVWLSDKFAENNGFALGDDITFTYRNLEISGEVKGLVKSGEYMICVADSNQLMPDFRAYGFAYVSPQLLVKALNAPSSDNLPWSQINIVSDLSEDDIEAAVNKALGVTTLLLSKENHYGYAAAQSEIEEGKTMGSMLPVLFLAIAVLTMITTMHRITTNEKIQIGTLKALGFRQRKITAHYTSYGLFLGLVGTLLGIALGYGIAGMIINPTQFQGVYFDLPRWDLYMPWFCWIVAVVAVAALTFISYLSVRQILKGTAADALRPYAPKKVKPLAIEKTKFWQKLSFGTRWNLRDLWRHKARSCMTLIGVVGCTILLVGGLGMKDTTLAFVDDVDKSYNYQTRINFTETITDEQAKAVAEKYSADTLSETSGETKGKTISLEIYDLSHNSLSFVDKNNNAIEFSDDGVYICVRLAEDFSVGETIEFSPYGSDETYSLKVVGVYRSAVSENIALSRSYAEKVGLPCAYKAAFTSVADSEITSEDYISGTQTKASVMASYDSFTDILDAMVMVLVVAAVVLGIIVLYNLGIMSYIERSRELSTLKVVGFRNGKIGKLLISQNMWLTVLGVIIGVPAGVGVLYALINMLASEYEFRMVLGALTYVVGVLVTFGVSLVVGLFVARKNKKIDMVEALKNE